MTVRKATVSDIMHWSRMRDSLWPDSAATNSQEIERFFAGDSVDIKECLLALENALPVGFIELNVRNYAEGSTQSPVPYVEGWFVDASYRGKGLGKLLMESAEAWAKSCGFSELASDTELENEKSISIHKTLGFTESDRIVCYIKNLS